MPIVQNARRIVQPQRRNVLSITLEKTKDKQSRADKAAQRPGSKGKQRRKDKDCERPRCTDEDCDLSRDKENDLLFQFLTDAELKKLQEGYKLANTS